MVGLVGTKEIVQYCERQWDKTLNVDVVVTWLSSKLELVLEEAKYPLDDVAKMGMA